MRDLIGGCLLSFVLAAGISVAHAQSQEGLSQQVSPQTGESPASTEQKGNEAARERLKEWPDTKGAGVDDVRGGQGNPSPDQVVGPPNAGPVPMRGDGLDLPGASPQTAPAKYSAENAKMLDYSIMGFPVQLSEEQRNEILKAIGNRSATASGLGKTIHAEAGVFLPPEVAAEELPGSLNQQIPQLRGLKYVKADDKILLIAPDNGIVRGVIEE